MDTGSWLTILGLGEDGPEGLPLASRRALECAEIIVGPPRHLALLGETEANCIAWPVPFHDGRKLLEECRGRPTVALVSGDPFWFGAGVAIADWLEPGEFTVLPGVSAFSLAAARLRWRLEDIRCRAHHAAPFDRLRSELAPGRRFILTLRDGAAVSAFADWLTAEGWGGSRLTVLEALGGPRERVRETTADEIDFEDASHPVVVALEPEGNALTCATGRADDLFSHDGQITKQPVRALTLAALAPRPGERLWDIGAGSGSIALEWLLADPANSAVAFEAREDRAARIAENAAALGLSHRDLRTFIGSVPATLDGQPLPDAVFVGGGLGPDVLDWLAANLQPGTRIVANAVTLETQALVSEAARRMGGTLMKIDLAEAEPLGGFRSWRASRTLVQWSVAL